MKQERFTRTCAGCGEKINKFDLIRVVRGTDGVVFIDDTSRANGRGAYVCKNAECLRKLRKTGRLARVLKCEIPADIYDKLEDAVGK